MSRRDHFIPETPEALSPAWLTDVLRGAKVLRDGAVLGVEQRVMGEGEGFVGDVLRLTLTLEPGAHAPRTLVAKLPKLANRAMGELIGAYERELLFYDTFARREGGMPVRIPAYYFGDFDRDRGSEKQKEILAQADAIPRWLTGTTTKLAKFIAARKRRRYVLLIEDVRAAPGDQLAGADRERCAQVLSNAARLHAAFWQAAELETHFWLLPLDIDARMRHGMMVAARPAFEQLFPEAVADGLTPYLDIVTRDGADLVRRLNEGPATLLHGDLRLDNLMFDDEGVTFLDWQLVRSGAPLYDVAYFLTSALEDEASAVPLLEHYHAALLAEGVESYPFEAVLADYRLALHAVLMTLSTVDQVEVGSDRGDRLLAGWMQRLRKRLQADVAMAA